tara:strand:+ start:32133 stop:33074 length:942 start_codon:yes stop_codon:yes gene_type:complete
MRPKILFIIDPISELKLSKDTSFAFMLEAQVRQFELYYCLSSQLFYQKNDVFCVGSKINVTTTPVEAIHAKNEKQQIQLNKFDIIMMRKDPPFDMNYIYATYLLEHASRQGALIINNPQGLRDNNEKVFITHFPECIPATTISSDPNIITSFISQYEKSVLKPLDGMGGKNIFIASASDPNSEVIIETLTKHHTTPIIIQEFIPEISKGDKRILILNGEAFPYALARIPKQGSIRGNLAAGGTAKGLKLTDREQWICEQVGPKLLEKGIYFAGIDVIGQYLTEINITSPTCLREIDAIFKTNIASVFFDGLKH